MSKPLKKFLNICEWVSRFGGVCAEISLVLLLALVFHEVIARYLMNKPTLYSVELSEYLLIFVAFMAAGWVMQKNRHVRMESVINLMPARFRDILEVISSCIVLCFCVILVWQGVKSSAMAFRGGYHSSSLLNVPLWLPYAIIPTGSFLLGLQVIVRIVEAFGRLTSKNNS